METYRHGYKKIYQKIYDGSGKNMSKIYPEFMIKNMISIFAYQLRDVL